MRLKRFINELQSVLDAHPENPELAMYETYDGEWVTLLTPMYSPTLGKVILYMDYSES